jgi:hypothetical protein
MLVVMETFLIQNKVGVLSVFECTFRSCMSKVWAAASLETIPETNSRSELVLSPFGCFERDESLLDGFWEGQLPTDGVAFFVAGKGCVIWDDDTAVSKPQTILIPSQTWVKQHNFLFLVCLLAISLCKYLKSSRAAWVMYLRLYKVPIAFD